MTRTRQVKQVRVRHSAAVLALVSIMLGPLVLQAQANNLFGVRVSEKEQRLATDDAAMISHLEQDLSFQRAQSRNKPYVELWNDVDSDDPITQLHMTIGDSRFHFSDDFLGEFALKSKSTPDVKINSTIMSNGDELVVNIEDGGLQPGEKVRFRIDIDVDPAYAATIFEFPDFRTVLVDLYGIDHYGPDPAPWDPPLDPSNPDEDNSFVWMMYGPAGESAWKTYAVAFEDPYPNHGGGSGNVVVNKLTSNCCSPCTEPIDPPIGVIVEPIPEPSSVVLAAVGLLAGAGICRRTRRRPLRAAN